MRSFLTLLCLIVAMPLTAQAAPPTAEDQSLILSKVHEIKAAMQADDYARMAAIIPPGIIARLAADAGMPEDALHQVMVQQLQQVLESVTIEAVEVGTEEMALPETANGTPYALFPSTGIMATEGTGRVKAISHTIALRDSGDWYIIRLDTPQQQLLLQRVFPEFAGIDFPAPQMELID